MPASSCFDLGPNGEWIRQADPYNEGMSSYGRVDYLIYGRAWQSDSEITMERMTAPLGWLEYEERALKRMQELGIDIKRYDPSY